MSEHPNVVEFRKRAAVVTPPPAAPAAGWEPSDEARECVRALILQMSQPKGKQ